MYFAKAADVRQNWAQAYWNASFPVCPSRRKKDENLLIGFESSDDAAVYRISEDTAIVQTLDFFPPMVEDPYIFGQIAAANALSDIYAMGGDVRTALNIVCSRKKWT